MKTFARVPRVSARTDQSHGVRNNGDRAVAGSSRATGFESGDLISGPGRPGPDDLEYIQAMFDCENPGRSGTLAGESLAAVLESHPRYPKLCRRRHRALFERLDDIVANHVDRRIMFGLGFGESGIATYCTAALTAFRAARPNSRDN